MSEFTQKCHIITSAYEALRAIYDDADLRKAKLSVTDYWECRRLMPLLGAIGNSEETVYSKAAAFFKSFGYTVEECGLGFKISI